MSRAATERLLPCASGVKKKGNKMKKLYYVESEKGCGIRSAETKDEAYKDELRSVGTYSGVRVCREATEEDIGWVRAMRGHIPSLEKENEF
jgi:hypothetical protein